MVHTWGLVYCILVTLRSMLEACVWGNWYMIWGTSLDAWCWGLLFEIHCWYISCIHWHMVYVSWLRHIMSDMTLVWGTWLACCMFDYVIGIGTLIEALVGDLDIHILGIWLRHFIDDILWYMVWCWYSWLEHGMVQVLVHGWCTCCIGGDIGLVHGWCTCWWYMYRLMHGTSWYLIETHIMWWYVVILVHAWQMHVLVMLRIRFDICSWWYWHEVHADEIGSSFMDETVVDLIGCCDSDRLTVTNLIQW